VGEGAGDSTKLIDLFFVKVILDNGSEDESEKVVPV